MAIIKTLPAVVLVFIFCLIMENSSFSAREILTTKPEPELLQPERVNQVDVAGGGILECWNALAEIKSCSNEIMIFIREGKNDIISSSCCKAISLITHNCLPSMLTSLGFTVDQTYILRGYCDEEGSKAVAFVPTQAPNP